MRDPIDALPVGIIFFGTVGIVVISIWIGNRVRHRAKGSISVEIRAALTPDTSIEAAIAESETIHERIEAQLTQLSHEAGLGAADAYLLRSIDEVVRYHNRRVAAAFHYRIPASIWPTLYGVLIFSMVGLGYTFGLKNSRNQLGSLALACSFSMVIYLTVDLDRPTAGLLIADQSALSRLGERLGDLQEREVSQ